MGKTVSYPFGSDFFSHFLACFNEIKPGFFDKESFFTVVSSIVAF